MKYFLMVMLGVALSQSWNLWRSRRKMAGKGARRLNFVLSENSYSKIMGLAKRRQSTMTEIVRLGLGLIEIVIQAHEENQQIVLATKDGHPLKIIVLPGDHNPEDSENGGTPPGAGGPQSPEEHPVTA